MQIWIVGRYLSQSDELHEGFPVVGWDFQGAFATEDKAIEACGESENCFIAPATLDKREPIERVAWEGSYYPLLKTGGHAAPVPPEDGGA